VGRPTTMRGPTASFQSEQSTRRQSLKITRHVRCPINILATNGVPSVPELKSLGVRRVSVGSGPARATFGLVKKIAHELRESGTYVNLLNGAPTLAEANSLVRPS